MDLQCFQTRTGALLAFCACMVNPAAADESVAVTRSGDVLRYAIPVATLSVELLRGERQGALEYSEALATSLIATEVLKRTTHVERPDRSDDKSFPSGHATAGFSAATYVHRRYGWEPALPLYALGTYVGYTRVQAHRHRWADVGGAALVSGAASYWLVHPLAGQQVAVVPTFAPSSIGVQLIATW